MWNIFSRPTSAIFPTATSPSNMGFDGWVGFSVCEKEIIYSINVCLVAGK